MAEIRDVLRLTIANMVEPISVNADRKCFYQLKESEVLKTKRGGFPDKKIPPTTKKTSQNKQKQAKKTLTNPQNPTQAKRRRLRLKLVWFFYSC